MTLTRSPVRSHTRSPVRGLTDLVGGISGPSISLSAPDFGGSTYYKGVDDNDISVTINNATDGASWDLTISSSGGGTPVTASGTVSGSTVNAGAQDLTGLNAGTLTFSYEEASVEVATKTRTLATQAAPDAPTNLVATHGDTQVGLSWDAPANVNGAVITDYVIEVDSGGGFSTITDGVSTNTTYTHTGLTNGTEYTYRVSAVNSVGTGAASATASATPCATPDQVGTVTPTAGNNQVALAWLAPGDGGSPITDYVVQYRETGSGSWLTFPDGTNASTGATVTGLANGTEYEFQVAAVNNEGQGAFSTAATATTNDVPAQVGTVTPVAGNGEVALSWSAPSNGGSAITDYIVQYKLSSSGTWLTFSDGVGTATTATVTGLTNDSAYDFRVAAVNALGTGAYSATVNSTPVSASAKSLALAALANATDAVAFDFTDTSTMTVNTDGTGGAPGNGDSVGRVSSLVNSHLMTAGSAAERPVYRSASGGYLDSDNVDDSMPVTFSGFTSDMTGLMVYRTSDGSFRLFSSSSLNGCIGFASGGGTTSIHINAGSPNMMFDDVAFTGTTRADVLAAAATSDWVKFEFDSADLTGFGTGFDLFNRENGTIPFDADIVLFIMYDATGMSAGDIADIEAWVDEMVPA